VWKAWFENLLFLIAADSPARSVDRLRPAYASSKQLSILLHRTVGAAIARGLGASVATRNEETQGLDDSREPALSSRDRAGAARCRSPLAPGSRVPACRGSAGSSWLGAQREGRPCSTTPVQAGRLFIPWKRCWVIRI